MDFRSEFLDTYITLCLLVGRERWGWIAACGAPMFVPKFVAFLFLQSSRGVKNTLKCLLYSLLVVVVELQILYELLGFWSHHPIHAEIRRYFMGIHPAAPLTAAIFLTLFVADLASLALMRRLTNSSVLILSAIDFPLALWVLYILLWVGRHGVPLSP